VAVLRVWEAWEAWEVKEDTIMAGLEEAVVWAEVCLLSQLFLFEIHTNGFR